MTISVGQHESATSPRQSSPSNGERGAADAIATFVRAPRVAGLTASYSGRIVATVRTVDEKGSAFLNQLVALEDGSPRYLTRGTESANLLAVGNRGEVYFARKDSVEEEKGSALWMLPPRGEARAILRHFGGIDSLAVTDRSLVIVASVMPSAATRAESVELSRKRTESKTSAVLHERFPIRYWDSDLDPATKRLFVAALPEMEDDDEIELRPVALPPSPDDVDEWTLSSVSPARDGARALVTMEARRGITDWTQVWVVELPSADDLAENEDDSTSVESAADHSVAPRLLATQEGRSCHGVAIAPNGTWALVEIEVPPLAGQTLDGELYRYDLVNGHATLLTGAFDNLPGEEVIADDDTVYLTANRTGRGGIFRLEADGGARLITPDDEYAYSSISWMPDEASATGSAQIVALRSSVVEPSSIVFVDPDTGKVAEGPRLVDDVDVEGELTEITATALDGTALRAWLALPEGDGPHPLVVFAHGGPWGSWNDWTWRWNCWRFTARGYAVLMPDPGISTGYGKQMVARGHDALANEPFTDIMALADAAVDRPDIDESRQAFAGGSYGGYMANWVAGHTGPRFRCIVTHAGLWNIGSMSVNTDNGGWYRWMTGELATGGTQAEKWSPHASASSIEVPMLVIHGDKDYRVPFGQALELWQDLQRLSPQLGHRFLYFPDEGHWILKPANAQVWYETFLAFLDQHVLGEDFKRPELLG